MNKIFAHVLCALGLVFTASLTYAINLPNESYEVKNNFSKQQIDELLEESFQLISQNPDSALRLIEIAESQSTLGKYNRGIALALTYKGSVFTGLGLYEKASQSFQKGRIELTKLGLDKELSQCLMGLGNLANALGDFETAEKHYLDALSIRQSLSDLGQIANTYNNLGVIAIKMGDSKKAESYFLKSLDYNKQSGNIIGMSHNYCNLGGINSEQHKNKIAFEYLQKALELQHQQERSIWVCYPLNGLALVLIDSGALDHAIVYGKEAFKVANQNGLVQESFSATNALYRAYKAMGETDSALKYLELNHEFEESIKNQQNATRLNVEHTKADLEIKESELEAMNSSQELQQVIIYASIGFILILVIFIVYATKNKKHLKRSHRELEALNQNLADKTAELEKSNAEKDKIFSIVSHDIRSPLASLKALLGQFNKGKIPERVIIQYTDKMHSQLDKVINLTDELLQWSRSQMNAIVAKPEPISVLELIVEQINFSFEKANAKNLKIGICAEEDDLTIWADLEMTKTILRNLIGNAIKFSEQGDQIEIGFKSENANAKIWVKDSGVGIPKEKLPHIFDSQGYSTYGTNNEKGTGLGLAICKEFLQKNNGCIEVISEIGVGSTFIFSLPLSAEQPVTHAHATETEWMKQ